MQGHYKNCPDPADCWCQVRKISRVLYITFAIIALQLVGSYLSHSLAVLADAGHTVMDSAMNIVMLTAAILVKLKWPLQKVDGAAFYINIALLFFTVGWILFETLDRFGKPYEIESSLMVLFGLSGFLGNYLQHRTLGKTRRQKNRVDESPFLLHIIGDMAVSGGVIAGGVIIFITGFTPIDLIISIAVAFWIFCMTIVLIVKRRADIVGED